MAHMNRVLIGIFLYLILSSHVFSQAKPLKKVRVGIPSVRMVMNYMKAHLEGIALFKRDREFGKSLIRKTLRIDEEDLINESYELFSKNFLRVPYPNTQRMMTSFEYVAMTRPEIWNHKPEEFVDSTLVAELEKSGFIKRLY